MRQRHLLALLIIATAIPTAFADSGSERKRDAEPATYCIYDLGRLPGLTPGQTEISVRAINNRNQIVGWTALSGGGHPVHAFIWDPKLGMRDLGSLPDHESSFAADINDAASVVGETSDSTTDARLAFVWKNTTGMRALDVSLGGVSTVATGINKSGQIVGGSDTATGGYHAFLRDRHGEVLDLGLFEDGDFLSTAAAVNDVGQVVGLRWTADGQIAEAFLWDERRGARIMVERDASLPFTYPQDINSRGEVVGEMEGGPTRAFRWTRDEGLQDLGTLTGIDTDYATASAINREGIIVGASQTVAGPPHASIWSRRSGMRDLNELIDPSSALASEAVIVIAQAINDAGWIAADGYVSDPADPQRSFLLVPRRHVGGSGCR